MLGIVEETTGRCLSAQSMVDAILVGTQCSESERKRLGLRIGSLDILYDIDENYLSKDSGSADSVRRRMKMLDDPDSEYNATKFARDLYLMDVPTRIKQATGRDIGLGSLFQVLKTGKIIGSSSSIATNFERAMCRCFFDIYKQVKNSEYSRKEFIFYVRNNWDGIREDPTFRATYRRGSPGTRPFNEANLKMIYNSIESVHEFDYFR